MLHRLLEVPLAVAHRTGRRALVAFDEFQDVLAVPGLDGLLRSHMGAGHPQRTMLLAWHLWEITAAGATATLELAQRALADALTDRRAELEAISQALSTVEQRVTVAVAHGLAPSGSRAQAGHRNPQPLRCPPGSEQSDAARTAHEGRRWANPPRGPAAGQLPTRPASLPAELTRFHGLARASAGEAPLPSALRVG